MDNLKNLLGMSSSVKSGQENTNFGVSGLNNSGGTARNRSDSECSNISDVSAGPTTITNPRQIKNKDSESYFWIM